MAEDEKRSARNPERDDGKPSPRGPGRDETAIHPEDESLPVAPIPGTPPREPAGESRHIGAYRVIRLIGQGGMGIVYEAEQTNPRRRVAVKLLRDGACADEFSQRLFEREIKALAHLEHSGIARIYEAGTTADGQRFFAMELAAGVPLDAYLRGRADVRAAGKSELRFRLRLFLDICRAIGYAHQRAVIHRDLKPSNIFVLETGSTGPPAPEIKVLDFGLARMAESAATLVAESGTIVGSLATMSPEQTTGKPEAIDIRSDIYSLGVVLYGMLTDHPPYALEGLDVMNSVRTIRETPPASPGRFVPLLHGDLETILLKCLEKDPERRYAGIPDLTDDIQRYLTDRPIRARPPTLVYQLRKLVARHRIPAILLGSLLIVLVGFAVTMSFMFGRERRLRSRAESESLKADQTADFVRGMLASVNPSLSGPSVTVREVLDQAALDVDAALRDQPEVRASVQETIGQSYLALGLYDQAEIHLRAALVTRKQILPPLHPDIAASLNDLGRVLLESGSDLREAENLAREALAILESARGREDLSVAASLNDLARVLQVSGRYAEAESLYRETLVIRTRITGARSPEIAESLNNLATLLQLSGRTKEAESLFRNALDIWTELLGADHVAIGIYLLNLAQNIQEQGRYAESEALCRRALVVERAHFGSADHPNVAAVENALALDLLYQGRYEAADSVATESLAMWRRLVHGPHEGTAVALANLAFLHQAHEDYDGAASLYEQSLEMRRALYGAQSRQVASSLYNVARIAHLRGNYAEADSLLRTVLASRRRQFGEDHRDVAEALVALGCVDRDAGRPDSAEVLLRRAMIIYGDEESWPAVSARHALGAVLAGQSRDADARPLIREATRYMLTEPVVPVWKRGPLRESVELLEAWGEWEMADRCREALRALPG